METELWFDYLGTVRRKRRKQISRTYCHRATSLLYSTASGRIIHRPFLVYLPAVAVSGFIRGSRKWVANKAIEKLRNESRVFRCQAANGRPVQIFTPMSAQVEKAIAQNAGEGQGHFQLLCCCQR